MPSTNTSKTASGRGSAYPPMAAPGPTPREASRAGGLSFSRGMQLANRLNRPQINLSAWNGYAPAVKAELATMVEIGRRAEGKMFWENGLCAPERIKEVVRRAELAVSGVDGKRPGHGEDPHRVGSPEGGGADYNQPSVPSPSTSKDAA